MNAEGRPARSSTRSNGNRAESSLRRRTPSSRAGAQLVKANNAVFEADGALTLVMGASIHHPDARVRRDRGVTTKLDGDVADTAALCWTTEEEANVARETMRTSRSTRSPTARVLRFECDPRGRQAARRSTSRCTSTRTPEPEAMIGTPAALAFGGPRRRRTRVIAGIVEAAT